MSARKHRTYHHLQLAAHRAQKMADREIARETGLTTAQVAVLAVLDTGEGETQREVATALGLNDSAVTAMVNRLMRLGYINRKRSDADGRVWLLELTIEGLRSLRGARAPFGRLNRIIDAELSPAEVRQLTSYLRRISGAFDDEIRQHKDERGMHP